MIPCPHCDREFEKRSGLMRHVQATHGEAQTTDLAVYEADVTIDVGPSFVSEPVPVNPGGAIEPVVPVESEPSAFAAVLPVLEQYAALQDLNEAATERLVGHHEPETYAESLDELEPGQEPYVDPPVVLEFDPEASVRTKVTWPTNATSTATTTVTTPVRLTMDDGPELEAALGAAPTPDQRTHIRQLIRSGRTESEAWQTVVGYEPPPRPPQPPDERPVRLQQVRNRIYTSRTGQVDQIDARWLLQLAEIGADAVKQLGYHQTEMYLDSTQDIIERWKAAIQ